MDREDALRLVKQLHDGRFIIAAWVPRAGEFYAVGHRDESGNPITARSLERLAAKGIATYAPRQEAEDAVLAA
jgi:hypothetical protein